MDIATIDAPAWVQAIGSVMAILVAGRVVELTARRTRLERLYGVDGIFNFCAVTVRDAAQKVQDGLVRPDDLQAFPEHRLRDCEAMLETVSGMLLEIGSERLPQMTSDASELIRSSSKALRDAQMKVGFTNDIAADGILLHANASELERLRSDVLKFVDGQKRRVDRWWRPFGS